MVKTLIINSTNYVENSGNKYIYRFPSMYEFSTSAKVGLQSIAIYNSTFNISSELGNNRLQIIWNANTSVTYNITIPDGYYSGPDFNYFLQSEFIARKLYMTQQNGEEYLYFFEIQTNSIRYAFQIYTYALPTAEQAVILGYSMPTGATWSLPTTSKSPQIVLSPSLGTLFGFKHNLTFPTLPSISISNEYLSDSRPILSPVSNYVISLNIISSKYCKPDNIFYAVPLNSSFGSLITLSSSNIIYNDISAGRYNEIVVTFYDQNFTPIKLNDTELLLVLAIIE